MFLNQVLCFSWNCCCFMCDLQQDFIGGATDANPEEDEIIISSPTSPPSISLLSPKAMEMAGCIIKYEKKQREKAQVRRRVSQYG